MNRYTIEKYKKNANEGDNKVVNYSENNVITLVGKIVSERRFSHEVYGEGFYIFDMEVPRLSENSDIIPVTVSERILNDDFKIGARVKIDGQFRSYNNYENERENGCRRYNKSRKNNNITRIQFRYLI